MSEQLQTDLAIEAAAIADVPQLVAVHLDAEIHRFPNKVGSQSELPTASEVKTFHNNNNSDIRFTRLYEQSILHNPHEIVQTVKLGSLIVGFSLYNSRTHWLGSLYIAPKFQGLGIGTLLLQNCLRSAEGSPMSLWTSDQTPSVAFYTKHGFSIDGPAPLSSCPQITPSKKLPLISMTHPG